MCKQQILQFNLYLYGAQLYQSLDFLFWNHLQINISDINIYSFCPISQFPQFWETFSDDSDDLIPVKSLLTVLGYTTKSSISSINKMSKINRLEGDYARMRSIKPDEMFTRFPVLAHVDFFTPGMKSIILQIAAHFSPPVEAEDVGEKIKKSVLRLANKVSLYLFFYQNEELRKNYHFVSHLESFTKYIC